MISWEEGGVGYSGGGDREPTELKSELNSEELGLFMVVRAHGRSRILVGRLRIHMRYRNSANFVRSMQY